MCARVGISRKTFYKYRSRFQAEGTAGAALAAEGWENGALSIQNRLLREGHRPPTQIANLAGPAEETGKISNRVVLLEKNLALLAVSYTCGPRAVKMIDQVPRAVSTW